MEEGRWGGGMVVRGLQQKGAVRSGETINMTAMPLPTQSLMQWRHHQIKSQRYRSRSGGKEAVATTVR